MFQDVVGPGTHHMKRSQIMLTRTAAAVKFDLPSTPEQKACSMHLGEGLKTFWSLVEHLQHAADEHQPIHQVEEIIFRELLVVGRWLLQAFLDLAGPGDVGPTLTVAGDSASDQDQELLRLDRPRKRPYPRFAGTGGFYPKTAGAQLNFLVFS